ncbi:hypothetical protein AZI86_11440 [Bdellovibrio bacteriovorus]|uniref:histidine kinase n=2 Tax=Bdellovibrio bacteriovorus TaxID=959 RepID=A0A150WLC5_BDEBC|nr:response regulator [Bdellovibrio bacteriovorus]KYG64811.1 hypothetical protein AZI86_11440 [Bdellovibrio bacteriovorus]
MICGTPIALVSLVDEKRQWFKSRVGIEAKETSREISFCGHAILQQKKVFEIPDASQDARFADNPLVIESKFLFYAGALLKSPSGEQIGTLCVIDHAPRKLTPDQESALGILAEQVMTLLEMRVLSKKSEKALQAQKDLEIAKVAADELASLERETFMRILEQTPEPIAILTGQDHTFRFANTAYKNLVGGKKVVGKTLAEVLPETVEQGFGKILDGVFQTGQPYHGNETKVQLTQKDGSLKPFFLNFSYQATRDVDGNIEGILVAAHDVTEQVIHRQTVVNANQIVADARYRLESSLTLMPVGVALFEGPDHKYAFTNEAHDKLLGGRTDHRGRSVAEAVPEAAAQGLIKLLDQVYQSGEPFYSGDTPLEFVQPDGRKKLFYVRFSYQALQDSNGKIYGIVATALDVTERKMLEKELMESKDEAHKANSAKSAFLANMSHEIRSPLGAIMGFCELLRSEDFTKEEMDEYLNVIDRNSSHLLRIIDDILDLSKVEAGKMLIEHIEFSLPDLLADFSSLMEFRAKEKGICFELQSDKIPGAIKSDPTRLRQILNNVVGNAIKFTDKGEVKVRVQFEKGNLEFLVADTGVGISSEQKEHLFQAFHQADVSTTRKFGGTGLGLVLTRRLAEALGGTFDLIESIPGQGSTFKVSICPEVVNELAAPGSFNSELAAPVPLINSELWLDGTRILVVDDSEDNQTLFNLYLRNAGAAIERAIDGQEGMVKALETRFDFILMDIQMPKMDGHEVTQALRAQGYAGPIVALTAHAMIEERERALQSGFSDFLAKPINRTSLFDVLRRLR